MSKLHRVPQDEMQVVTALERTTDHGVPHLLYNVAANAPHQLQVRYDHHTLILARLVYQEAVRSHYHPHSRTAERILDRSIIYNRLLYAAHADENQLYEWLLNEHEWLDDRLAQQVMHI